MRMNFIYILENDKTINHQKYRDMNTQPGILMPKKVHKTSAQLPSPVKARIITSKKGSVEIR